jgi:hypothetical protein
MAENMAVAHAPVLAPRWYAVRTAHATAMVGMKVALRPTLIPTIMFVPWPVVLASAMLWTGRYL